MSVLSRVSGACRTISRFLCPDGRQSFLWAGHYCPALATYPEVERSGPLLLPYLVLLHVGFALPAGSLRPRCALTAPFHPYPCGRYIFCGTFRETRFERIPPAVSRHAALWRPDFPPICLLSEASGRLPVRRVRSHYAKVETLETSGVSTSSWCILNSRTL